MANKKLNAIINIGGAISGSLKSALGSTKTGLTEIGKEIKRLENNQRSLSNSITTFGKMGKNVDTLREKYARVTTEIEKARRAQERMGAHQAAKDNFGKAGGRFGKAVAVGAAVGAAAFMPVKQAIDFENAMMGVSKQLDGARDSSGNLTPKFQAMKKEIQMLGRELPTSTNNIAEMVAAGLRMGVAEDEVIGFVRSTAAMSTAFELPEAELAESMGKIAGLYKIPIPAIGDLADSINYLDDNAIAKGGDIIEFLKRTGGVAGAVKVTGKEMTALGSTLLTMGESTETAGTSVNAMFAKLASATKGTGKFKSAMSEVGLSVDKVQKGMQTDAIGTMQDVFTAISKQDPSKHLGLLVEMFGQEHAPKLSKLVNGMGELRRQLELVDSAAAKGSMAREFEARMKGTTAQFEITKNLLTEGGVAIGAALLPAINSIMGAVAPVLAAFADWASKNQKLIATVTGVVVGITAFSVAATGIAFVVSGLKVGITGLKLLFGGLGFVTSALNVGLVALKATLAWIGTGIGLMSIAIVAGAVIIGGAAYLIYKHWDTVKAAFNTCWDAVVSGGKIAIGWLKDVFLKFTPLGLVISNWEPLSGFFSNLFGGIVEKARGAMDWIINKISAIGDLWTKTKSLFGIDAAPTATPAGATGLQTPDIPKPAMRGGSGAQISNVNTFNITQKAGQDSKQFADEVARKIAEQNAIRSRGKLIDGVS
jgi:TP901 family phage tail tape measure protein